MSDRLQLFQVDAFTSDVFGGNPAAVCPLREWLPDPVLQAIAEENNLAETAFFVPEGDGYRLRWFTPRYEVPLCGHATLAAGFVLFRDHVESGATIRFHSASGELRVRREDDLYTLDFPRVATEPCDDPPQQLLRVPGLRPVAILTAESDPNHFLVLEREEDVRAVEPPLATWEGLHPYGVVVTAPGNEVDFVSRYFAPSYGIPEDPVTGSIHCALAPYWAERLGRSELWARQLSRRGGQLRCRVEEGRVFLSGPATLYLEGEIVIS